MFSTMLNDATVKLARFTGNRAVRNDEQTQVILDRLMEHTHPKEEAQVRATTVKLKDIETFLKAAQWSTPLALDKDGEFYTSMQVDQAPPVTKTFAQHRNRY